ncbi:MAG: hypothetical protein ACKPKO_62120, partial [Candidatus Fonsibacter sp.]
MLMMGFHTNQASTVRHILLGRRFCSVVSMPVAPLVCGHMIGIMDAHVSKIDIPDLPVPAMGTDAGTGVAEHPPAFLSTLVSNWPNMLLLSLG